MDTKEEVKVCHVGCARFRKPITAPDSETGWCRWAEMRRLPLAAVTAGSVCKFPMGYCSPAAAKAGELDCELPDPKRAEVQEKFFRVT